MSAVRFEPQFPLSFTVRRAVVRRAVVLLLKDLNTAGSISAWLLTVITLENRRHENQYYLSPSSINLKGVENWERAHKALVGVAASIGAFCHSMELWLMQHTFVRAAVFRRSQYCTWKDHRHYPLDVDYTDVICKVRLYKPEYRIMFQADYIGQNLNKLSSILRNIKRLFETLTSEQILPMVPVLTLFAYNEWGKQALQCLCRLGYVASAFICIALGFPISNTRGLPYINLATSTILKCIPVVYIRQLYITARCTTTTAGINLTVSVATATRVLFLALLRYLREINAVQGINDEDYEISRSYIVGYINNFSRADRPEDVFSYLHFMETYAVGNADAYEYIYTAQSCLIAEYDLRLRD
jgi:hypothetical protein